jgi:hypothetical protein
MPNDPYYDAMLGLAEVHILKAFEAFSHDAAVPWDELTGNVPKVRHQVFVDALKKAVAHHEQIERLLS